MALPTPTRSTKLLLLTTLCSLVQEPSYSTACFLLPFNPVTAGAPFGQTNAATPNYSALKKDASDSTALLNNDSFCEFNLKQIASVLGCFQHNGRNILDLSYANLITYAFRVTSNKSPVYQELQAYDDAYGEPLFNTFMHMFDVSKLPLLLQRRFKEFVHRMLESPTGQQLAKSMLIMQTLINEDIGLIGSSFYKGKQIRIEKGSESQYWQNHVIEIAFSKGECLQIPYISVGDQPSSIEELDFLFLHECTHALRSLIGLDIVGQAINSPLVSFVENPELRTRMVPFLDGSFLAAAHKALLDTPELLSKIIEAFSHGEVVENIYYLNRGGGKTFYTFLQQNAKYLGIQPFLILPNEKIDNNDAKVKLALTCLMTSLFDGWYNVDEMLAIWGFAPFRMKDGSDWLITTDENESAYNMHKYNLFRFTYRKNSQMENLFQDKYPQAMTLFSRLIMQCGLQLFPTERIFERNVPVKISETEDESRNILLNVTTAAFSNEQYTDEEIFEIAYSRRLGFAKITFANNPFQLQQDDIDLLNNVNLLNSIELKAYCESLDPSILHSELMRLLSNSSHPHVVKAILDVAKQKSVKFENFEEQLGQLIITQTPKLGELIALYATTEEIRVDLTELLDSSTSELDLTKVNTLWSMTSEYVSLDWRTLFLKELQTATVPTLCAIAHCSFRDGNLQAYNNMRQQCIRLNKWEVFLEIFKLNGLLVPYEIEQCLKFFTDEKIQPNIREETRRNIGQLFAIAKELGKVLDPSIVNNFAMRLFKDGTIDQMHELESYMWLDSDKYAIDVTECIIHQQFPPEEFVKRVRLAKYNSIIYLNIERCLSVVLGNEKAINEVILNLSSFRGFRNTIPTLLASDKLTSEQKKHLREKLKELFNPVPEKWC
ncbi:MAG: hypothetical protein LBJ89_00880 [Holosporales bacterium]|jgi:hypothetical protein|nr:hypothetical protein [Holosporales bacterium]